MEDVTVPIAGFPPYPIAGIDPGLHGGMAVLYPDGQICMFRPPVHRYRSGRRAYHIGQMRDFLDEHPIGGATLVCDDLRPEMASTNMYGFGLWVGMLFARHIQHGHFTPEGWKSYIHIGKAQDMEAIRRYFEYRFPRSRRHRTQCSRKPTDGAVIAACLAECTRQFLLSEALQAQEAKSR